MVEYSMCKDGNDILIGCRMPISDEQGQIIYSMTQDERLAFLDAVSDRIENEIYERWEKEMLGGSDG